MHGTRPAWLESVERKRNALTPAQQLLDNYPRASARSTRSRDTASTRKSLPSRRTRSDRLYFLSTNLVVNNAIHHTMTQNIKVKLITIHARSARSAIYQTRPNHANEFAVSLVMSNRTVLASCFEMAERTEPDRLVCDTTDIQISNTSEKSGCEKFELKFET